MAFHWLRVRVTSGKGLVDATSTYHTVIECMIRTKVHR